MNPGLNRNGSTTAALLLAHRAHTGQVDKAGRPYMEHPLRVAKRLTTAEERTVALLHDTVEDTWVTFRILREHGFSDDIIGAVDALTKRPGEKLEQSMERIMTARRADLARTVKMADIADNTAPRRRAMLDEASQERLNKKYTRSATLLGTTLGEIRFQFGLPEDEV